MSNNCKAYTLTGLMQDCDNSKGGIKKVFIATENPNPITLTEPIDLELAWFGFAIVKTGSTYKYSDSVTGPADSTRILVNKGDVIEFTLNVDKEYTAKLAIGELYGPERPISEVKEFTVTPENNKIRVKIGEGFGKSITGESSLTIHLNKTTEPTGSTAYNTAELGKITRFGNEVDWYEYNFKKNTGSFTSTLNVDPTNGINFISTELTLQFNKMNTVKRVEMAALAVNEMWVIVLDSNNTYWFLGYDEAVAATSGTSQTGTTKTDGNFYQITMTDESKTWPFEVTEDALPL